MTTTNIKREHVSANVTRKGNAFSLKFQGAGDKKIYRLKFNESENIFEGDDELGWWWKESIRLKFDLPDSQYRQQLYKDIITLAEAEQMWKKANLRQGGVSIRKWKIGRDWVTTRSEMEHHYGLPPHTAT